MLSGLEYSIAGLILYILLFVFLSLQYNKQFNTVKQLKILLIFLFITDVFDILSTVAITNPENIPVWMIYVFYTCFFELEVIVAALLPKYIRFVIDPEKGKKIISDYILDFVVIIFSVICITSFATKFIFSIDENKIFHNGSLGLLNYIVPYCIVIYTFVRLLVNRKNFGRRKFLSILGFVIISMTGPILQILVLPDVKIEFFAFSIAAFIVVLGLETPDYVKIVNMLEELEKHKDLLEKAKEREEEINKNLHQMTKSASWSLHFDADNNITYMFWSDEFFWLLGYETDEINVQETNLWADSLHPDDYQETMDKFMQGMHGLSKYNTQYRLKSKDGTYHWYNGTGDLKINPEDKSGVYHGIIRNVDDEKIKEDLTKEKIEALEALEESQKALEDAVIRAESADRAKSDFLAHMSHEIRTPINAVLGMNELISRESTERNVLEYSASVADAGQSLLTLINDILDFSKIEAGKMEIVPSDYELTDLIREVNNMIAIRCKSKGLEYIVKNNPNIPRKLFGDEVRIRQIMVNLLNNALKYTDSGSVTLSLDYEEKEVGTIVLIISAIDTGIGIKEENLSLLFESFKRIDLEQNRKREGTGLGLNITKSFVELMGGSVDVKSVYGLGSTFTVRIPQQVKGTEKIGVINSELLKSTKKKYKSVFKAPEAKILAVDDVQMNLKVIQGLLKQTEITVDMVTSGKECLESIALTEYDVILLDHMMPEMDGIETINHIKENKSHPNQNTPIIMLSANAIVGAKEEYIAAGFTDYLSKPVRADELEQMLIKYLPSQKVVLS